MLFVDAVQQVSEASGDAGERDNVLAPLAASSAVLLSPCARHKVTQR